MKQRTPSITVWQRDLHRYLGTEPKTFAECYHRIKQCERSKDLIQLLAVQSFLTLLYWETNAISMIDDQIKVLNSIIPQLDSSNDSAKIRDLVIKLIDTLTKSKNDTTIQECLLTKQEAQLVGILERSGPQTKFQLIEALFGESIDIFSGENRLKNLLSRIRQKAPDSILLKESTYYLNKHFKYKIKTTLTNISDSK